MFFQIFSFVKFEIILIIEYIYDTYQAITKYLDLHVIRFFLTSLCHMIFVFGHTSF